MPKTVRPSETAATQRRLPLLLRRAWFSLNQAFRRRIAQRGLTPDQFTILRWLHESDPRGISQCQVCDLMTSDPNTVASLLARMEAAGLVERRRHETDRRANRIRPTLKGKKAFASARMIAARLQKDILSVLPAASRRDFLRDLEQVADACRRQVDEDGAGKR